MIRSFNSLIVWKLFCHCQIRVELIYFWSHFSFYILILWSQHYSPECTLTIIKTSQVFALDSFVFTSSHMTMEKTCSVVSSSKGNFATFHSLDRCRSASSKGCSWPLGYKTCARDQSFSLFHLDFFILILIIASECRGEHPSSSPFQQQLTPFVFVKLCIKWTAGWAFPRKIAACFHLQGPNSIGRLIVCTSHSVLWLPVCVSTVALISRWTIIFTIHYDIKKCTSSE